MDKVGTVSPRGGTATATSTAAAPLGLESPGSEAAPVAPGVHPLIEAQRTLSRSYEQLAGAPEPPPAEDPKKKNKTPSIQYGNTILRLLRTVKVKSTRIMPKQEREKLRQALEDKRGGFVRVDEEDTAPMAQDYDRQVEFLRKRFQTRLTDCDDDQKRELDQMFTDWAATHKYRAIKTRKLTFLVTPGENGKPGTLLNLSKQSHIDTKDAMA